VTYEPKTDEEIKDIALGWMGGSIFTSHNLKPEEMSMVFMVTMFLDDEGIEGMKTDNITLLYEDLAKALPRGVNGKPMFMSAKMLNQSDHQRLLDTVKKLQEAIDAV
jgi:hypothetical protein